MAITTSSQKTHPGKSLSDSGPSPPLHPFLYDVDNDDGLSFDIMSSEFAFCIIMSDSLFQMGFSSNSSPTEKMAGFAP